MLCARHALVALSIVMCTLAASMLISRTPFEASCARIDARAGALGAVDPHDEQPDRPLARPDLYGNPVMSAIATYRLDSSGDLYEEHSPTTELPSLAPPRS